jgi:SAM-dependent methyltransferase
MTTFEITTLQICRICGSDKLFEFLNLGNIPIPNGFLQKEELKKKESKFPLVVVLCNNCFLVQLKYIVNPEIMFGNYLYIPSSSQTRLNHFKDLAEKTKQLLHLKEDSLVIDIGSNDGSLLNCFKNLAIKVLGVDPAENLVKVAQLNGINTIHGYFNTETAKQIKKTYKKASAIFATNVFAHVGDLHEFMTGINILLDNNGIFIAQFPYLLDLIEQNQFDTIYHEHLSYFSVYPLLQLTKGTGLEIIDIERNDLDGGSIRVFWKKTKNSKFKKNENSIEEILKLENEHGLYDIRTFRNFAKRINELKIITKKELVRLKKGNKKIVGYGAAAKGNILLNCFHIGPRTLDYIVDSTPFKQGLYIPGMHIPIYDEEKIYETKPDYILILAWNFKEEIMKKNTKYSSYGKYIVCIPAFTIL